MIEILTKLKTPDKINLSGIKWYWDNTPSVTWILSLIDSYEPNSEDIQEALDKWTNLHNDMESVLWWKTNYLKSSHNVYHIIPYASFLIPQDDTELLMLEHQISIPWVFWWTIDYDKEKKTSSLLVYSLLDYKTAKTFPSFNSSLFHKYKLQLKWYSILKNAITKAMVTKETLLFVNDSTTQFVKINDDKIIYMEFFILLMYYHYLAWTLLTNNKSLYSLLSWYNWVMWYLQLNITSLDNEERIWLESKYPWFINAINTLINNLQMQYPSLTDKEVISKPKHIIVYKDIDKTIVSKNITDTSENFIDINTIQYSDDDDYDDDYDEDSNDD